MSLQSVTAVILHARRNSWKNRRKERKGCASLARFRFPVKHSWPCLKWIKERAGCVILLIRLKRSAFQATETFRIPSTHGLKSKFRKASALFTGQDIKSFYAEVRADLIPWQPLRCCHFVLSIRMQDLSLQFPALPRQTDGVRKSKMFTGQR